MNDARAAVERIAERAAAELMEHATSVQIIVTARGRDGGTVSFATGRGCFYSRLGAAREWVVKQDERVRRAVAREDDEDAAASA